LNLIRAVDLRSNGHHALRLSGRRWRRRIAPAARLGRRRIAGMGRKRPSDLDFERGWHWEHARGTGNSSKAAARAITGRAELTAAHGGAAATASVPGRSGAKEREKQAGEPHYLGANLLEGLKSTGTRWNGGVALDRAPAELQRRRRV